MPPSKKSPAVEALTFEQALAQIESIIERIESGETGLEESLQQYERGVALVNHCRARLDQAQQQVEDLTRRLAQADNETPAHAPASTGGDPDDDPDPEEP